MRQVVNEVCDKEDWSFVSNGLSPEHDDEVDDDHEESNDSVGKQVLLNLDIFIIDILKGSFTLILEFNEVLLASGHVIDADSNDQEEVGRCNWMRDQIEVEHLLVDPC